MKDGACMRIRGVYKCLCVCVCFGGDRAWPETFATLHLKRAQPHAVWWLLFFLSTDCTLHSLTLMSIFYPCTHTGTLITRILFIARALFPPACAHTTHSRALSFYPPTCAHSLSFNPLGHTTHLCSLLCIQSHAHTVHFSIHKLSPYSLILFSTRSHSLYLPTTFHFSLFCTTLH